MRISVKSACRSLIGENELSSLFWYILDYDPRTLRLIIGPVFALEA